MMTERFTMKKGFALLLLQLVIFIGVRASEDCLTTLHDFQKSLLNRTVNLDSLSTAFSPPNRQASISFTVHYHFCSNNVSATSSKILCSDLEQWANDINAGRNPAKDFAASGEYKFLWNASPINLFIRPKLLESLSLYSFRIDDRETHLILDQICDTLIQPPGNTTTDHLSEASADSNGNKSHHDPLNDCYNPRPELILLEQLTANLKSFHLHKESFFTHGGTSPSEIGYPTYYYDPDNHVTDVCVLNEVQYYRTNRYILGVAIFLTQLLIPCFVPFASRLIISRKTKMFAQSDFKHYLRGFITTLVILDCFVFAGNFAAVVTEERTDVSKSTMSDVRMFYIFGLVMLLVVNPLNIFINTCYNSGRHYGRCCSRNTCEKCERPCYFCWDCKSSREVFLQISIVVLAVSSYFLAFNSIYIFMGVIAAPVETGSLIFLYATVFFLLTMFFALMSKGFGIVRKLYRARANNEGYEQINSDEESSSDVDSENDYAETENNHAENDHATENDHAKWYKRMWHQSCHTKCCLGCDIVIGLFIAVLTVATMVLYLTFYYRMAVSVEPYSSSSGFLSSFGTLVPAIFTLTAGLLEKRLINLLSGPKSSTRRRNDRGRLGARGGIQ